MNKDKLIPKLRFKEFVGEWRKKNLEEVSSKIGSGSTPRGGSEVYLDKGITFIRSQNVNENRLLLDDVAYISESTNSSMKGSVVKGNDILLNITGASIGRSCVVPLDFEIGNVNQHVCIIRLDKNNSIFFQNILSSSIGKKLIFQSQTGSGRDYKHLEKGDIPVFGTGGYMLSVDKYLYEGKTVCIGRKGTIDKPFYYEGKLWTVDTLFYTHNFIECLPKFIYYTFQKINWKLYNEASGVPSLSKSTIEKIKINFPCLEEQQKIADFLISIDSKIENISKEIQKNKDFKKGLLQQMFC